MGLRRIPLRPLTSTFNQESFDYKYVDAMQPKSARFQKLLVNAENGPIWINWEGYSSFTKDLRELVKMKALVLKREYLKPRRSMSKLHLTAVGKKLIKR